MNYVRILNEDLLAISYKNVVDQNDYLEMIKLLELQIQMHGECNFFCDISNVVEVRKPTIWRRFSNSDTDFSKINKIALLGRENHKDIMLSLFRNFYNSQIKYFQDKQEARSWVLI